MQPSRKAHQPRHQLLHLRVEPLEDRWLLDAQGVVAVLPLATQPAEALVRTPNQTAIVEPLRPSSSLDQKERISSFVLLATGQTSVATSSPDISTAAAREAPDRATAPLPQFAENGDTQAPVLLTKVVDSSLRSSLAPRSIDLFVLDTNSRVPSPESGLTSVRLDRLASTLSSAPVEPVPISPSADTGATLPGHGVLSTGDTRSLVVLGMSAHELSRLASLGTNAIGDYLLVISARIAHEAMLAAERAANPGNESGTGQQTVTDELTTPPRIESTGESETLHFALQGSEAQAGPRSLREAHLIEDFGGEKKASATASSDLRERSLGSTAAVQPPALTEDALRSGRSPSGALGGTGSVRGPGESDETPVVTEAEVAGDALPRDPEMPPTRVSLPEPPDSPKGAGLLTEFTPVQLRALEVTMQMFGQQLHTAAQEPRGTLFWAGISCACLTAAAVAVGVAKRRQSALRLLSEHGAGDSFLAFDNRDDLLMEDGV
jgi:hypothetical protein